MAYCTNCGNEISATEAFCTNCGARNEAAAPVTPSSQTSAGTTAAGGGVQLRPLGIGEIVDVGVRIYRDHALTLFKIVAFVVVPVQILAALVQASTVPDAFDTGFPGAPIETEPTTGELPFDFSDLWTFIAGSLVVAVLGFLASQLATAASLKAVSDAYLGQDPDAETSLRFALGRLGPLIWLAFLQGLLVFLGLLACLIPGIFFAVAWSVAIPALLTEDVRGWSALKRSRELVRDRWWLVFGALAIVYILAGIVGFIVNAIFGLAIPGASGSLAVSFFSSALGGAISSVLTTPFMAAIIAVMYFDLRVRKEGFDLELLARSVGADPPTGGGPGGTAGGPGAGGLVGPGGGAFGEGTGSSGGGAFGESGGSGPGAGGAFGEGGGSGPGAGGTEGPERPKPRWDPPSPDGPTWESH